MTYNPNQARNAKGSPMAGAWTADNARGGAAAEESAAIAEADDEQRLINLHIAMDQQYRRFRVEREKLRPLAEERFRITAGRINPDIIGVYSSRDDDGYHFTAAMSDGSEDPNVVSDNWDLHSVATDLAELDYDINTTESEHMLLSEDTAYRRHDGNESQQRLVEKINWGYAALHVSDQEEVSLEVAGNTEDGFDFADLDDSHPLWPMKEQLRRMLPEKIDQAGHLVIRNTGSQGVIVSYAGDWDNLQYIHGRPARLPLNADQALEAAQQSTAKCKHEEGA